MSRPRKLRRICWHGNAFYFKPRGIPLRHLDEVPLSLEEIESLRLKDFLGLDQVLAAKRMKISQSTFQRILVSARQKVADGLINGKALRIEY